MELKQKYLREHIIDSEYDPNEFSNFLLEAKTDGNDINKWELEELIRQVQKFKYMK